VVALSTLDQVTMEAIVESYAMLKQQSCRLLVVAAAGYSSSGYRLGASILATPSSAAVNIGCLHPPTALCRNKTSSPRPKTTTNWWRDQNGYNPILARAATGEQSGVGEERVGSRWRQKVVAGVNADENGRRSKEGVLARGGGRFLLRGVSAEYF
jgi:hypothetical protein